MRQIFLFLIVLFFTTTMSAIGQIAEADVDSVALSTSATTTRYTATTMWREVVIIARGGDAKIKIAHTIADTTEWATNPYMPLLENESISIIADYKNNNTGLRAIKAKVATGTGALILIGSKKER